jgi:DNA-binding CsgD family transcriptional regulator
MRSNANVWKGCAVNHLTRNDYAAALRLLARLEASSGDPEAFAQASLAEVNGFVASEFATLSACDLVTGHRAAFSADDNRRMGLAHAVAVPLLVDGGTLVSLVVHRRGLGFSERDRERLELLRPHLAFLYRQACANAGRLFPAPRALVPAQPDPLPEGLTLREGEVMRWLACGKTDAEIAALLAISPRTVHKHLEHIYVKLGVETRTAAVMRSLAMRRLDGRTGAGGISHVCGAAHESAAHMQPG